MNVKGLWHWLGIAMVAAAMAACGWSSTAAPSPASPVREDPTSAEAALEQVTATPITTSELHATSTRTTTATATLPPTTTPAVSADLPTVLEIESPRLFFRMVPPKDVVRAELSGDGQRISTVYCLADETGHSSAPTCPAQVLALWDVDSGHLTQTIGPVGAALGFVSSSQVLVVDQDRAFVLVDAATGERHAVPLRLPEDRYIEWATLAGDGQELVYLERSTDRDPTSTLRAQSLAQAGQHRVLFQTQPNETLLSAAIDPGLRRVAVSVCQSNASEACPAQSQFLQIFDVATGSLLGERSGESVGAFHLSEPLLLTTRPDEAGGVRLSIWSVDEGALIAQRRFDISAAAVDVAWAEREVVVVGKVADRERLVAWNIDSNVQVSREIATTVRAVGISDDARTILVQTDRSALAIAGPARGPAPGNAVETVDAIGRLTPMAPFGAQMSQVSIPEGSFWMGSDEEVDTGPAHSVSLPTFRIDQYEVTQRLYAACVEAGACDRLDIEAGSDLPDGYVDRATYLDFPVNTATWDQADAYCRWANGRLPTEAEWEKAARGTDARRFPWGDASPYSRYDVVFANFEHSFFGGPLPGGHLPLGASPYGVMDMAGNAPEWVADWYAPDYAAAISAQDLDGPAFGTLKLTRGGGLTGDGSTYYLTTFARLGVEPDWAVAGMRCAYSP